MSAPSAPAFPSATSVQRAASGAPAPRRRAGLGAPTSLPSGRPGPATPLGPPAASPTPPAAPAPVGTPSAASSAHGTGAPGAGTEPLPPLRRSTPLGAPVQRAAVPVTAAAQPTQPTQPTASRPALGAPLSTRPADAAPLNAPSGIPIGPQGDAPRAATGPGGVSSALPPFTPPVVQRSAALPGAPELPLPTASSARGTGTPTHRPAAPPQDTATGPTGPVPRTVRPTTTTGQHHPAHTAHPVALTGRPPVAPVSPVSPVPVQRHVAKAPVPLRRTTPGATAGGPVARPYPTPAPGLTPGLAPATAPATLPAPPAPVLQRRALPAPGAAAGAPVRPAAPPSPLAPPAQAAPIPVPVSLPVPPPAPRPLPAAPTAPAPVVQRRHATLPPTLPKPPRGAGGPPSGADQGAADPAHAHAQAHPGFDPRALTDFQLDELTHRLTGRITRLLRTELRLDRERIGRLRDPRH
ncbi:hypothetical protein [Streptomyces zaehneri]|uniref:hypothetical protein n=1 Tax=Streptomyces zaehneri TaxID=3051180 RepID=UPI0028D74397|nr:hypothetical protein [Streptomyces sp. DSM 40713]